MTAPRPHPFDLVFGSIAPERFPAIRDGLGEDVGLDAFLLDHSAVQLLHDLRPDDGLGAAIDDYVVFVHAAFRYWLADPTPVEFDAATTVRLCRPVPDNAAAAQYEQRTRPAGAMYIQVAPRTVWGQPTGEGPFEPLDGWFRIDHAAGSHIVACFGVHPSRPGLSVMTAAIGAAPPPRRPDGSPVFSPTMPGGAEAGLFAVTGGPELALLAERASDLMEEESWLR